MKRSTSSLPPGRRRAFLKTVIVAGLATGVRARAASQNSVSDLRQVADKPVLDVSFLKQPVKIASVELLRNGSVFLVRVRSTDGVEAVTVPNPSRMALMYPLFLRQVAPFFVGKDARDLERLLWEVYRHNSNYKFQGLALWVCVAAIEMALLELMAQTARRPLADFFGGTVRRDIPVYVASSNRGNSPEVEIAHLQKLVADSGAKALKFRLGGRMSRNADSLPGRSETLIPKVRTAFGDAVTLYADANSSYGAREGIRIGKLMEAHGYGFFEEPCEFDDLWGTKDVADALNIPVAGGEQEFSLHRWQWMIANRAVDIVQPDLHYGGGLIRATQVARMAAAASMKVVPHMSGGLPGCGAVRLVHGQHRRVHGIQRQHRPAGKLRDSSLKCERGSVRCPSGTGFGVTLDPKFVDQAAKL